MGKSIGRSTLSDRVAEDTGLSRSLCDAVVSSFLRALAGALEAGESVRLAGYMKLEAKTVGARTGRNLRTGEAVPVGERRRVKVALGARLSRIGKGGSREG